MMEQVRKHVYDLTPPDLAAHPVWEFCLDEEWVVGQDETTVRNRDDVQAVGGRPEGDFVVSAEFRLRDGSVLGGYVVTREEDDPSARQPVIVTERGQVGFWRGALPLTPAELAEAYDLLGRRAEEVFPVRYRSRVWVGTDFLKGTIRGFCYLDKAEGMVEVR